jgi:hypothetical protein
VGAIKRQFRQTSGAVLRGEIGEYSSARYAEDDAGAQRLERAKRIVSDDEDNASDRDDAAAKEVLNTRARSNLCFSFRRALIVNGVSSKMTTKSRINNTSIKIHCTFTYLSS